MHLIDDGVVNTSGPLVFVHDSTRSHIHEAQLESPDVRHVCGLWCCGEYQ